MSLTVNGITVASMRWRASWSGVWTADVEVSSAADLVPSGRVAIASTEGIALVGTVDGARSGKFGEKRHARVIGGGGGWSKNVRAQHYRSAVGVPLQLLASTTAAEVGEVVTVLVPQVVGLDFARRAGPASQIFVDAGVDWWVGLDGITRVGIRLPAVPPTSLQIADWDPAAGTMSFSCDVFPEPGTVIVDPRFGRRVVRAVEAEVAGGMVRGTLWVADAQPAAAGTVEELGDALALLANEATRAALSRVYEYRVIAMAGDEVELQAVRRADGVPDILPGRVWAGISGYRAVLTPASRVLVGFAGGDARYPYVAAYEPPGGLGWRPMMLELDAVASVEIGAQAVSVLLGGVAGAQPVAKSVGVLAALTAIGVYAQAVAVVSPATQPAAQALAAALAPLATTIPSPKVLAA